MSSKVTTLDSQLAIARKLALSGQYGQALTEFESVLAYIGRCEASNRAMRVF